MSQKLHDAQFIHNALRMLPSNTFVLTCAHDQYRNGIITKWVQRCSDEPPMIVVAIKKGQAIEPMLRDARAFALCMIPNGNRRMIRLFGKSHEADDDPFLATPTTIAETGMPIIKESIAWFDCLLEGHLSPDSDSRLYLGKVVAAYAELSAIKSNNHEPITPPSHDVSQRQRIRKTTSKSSR